ncbi:MATE family efflux transporter [Feifania hominis]|uniref:Probable multidrug resistance protein NorM n=1 Tax=Feifania hominis TaxID=2763660 RepID=A0A926DBC1_9FIRM|nr:MATE family efflux transporter [Feifania hominis]MBC8535855.1 MATE family efflux transporter [Feifania hominis]
MKDMTKGSPLKLILSFALPLLLGNIFQQFYNMADTIIVGRTISVDALAAVGSVGSFSYLIIGVSQGLTTGFSVVTAQRFGAGDQDGVRRSAATSAILTVLITVVFTTLSVLFCKPVMRLMSVPADIFQDAYRYIVVICGGLAATMLFNLLSNLIRALGDSRTPVVFLVIACLLNIVLDFAFILIFHMGVAGAAIATVISQFVSGAMCLIHIVRRFPILRFEKSDLRLEQVSVWNHVRIGLPMAFQSSVISIGSMTVQAAVNRLGSTAVAAITACHKIDNLGQQPLMSFGIAMGTYAAQNFGAGDIPRIRAGVRRCAAVSVATSLTLGAILILGGNFLVGLFVGPGKTEILGYAKTYLVTNCSMYFVLAFLFIYRYTLQGLGRSFIPTVAGLMELAMRCFTAGVLSKQFGFQGICFSNPLAWLGSAIPLCISYYIIITKLSKATKKVPLA